MQKKHNLQFRALEQVLKMLKYAHGSALIAISIIASKTAQNALIIQLVSLTCSTHNKMLLSLKSQQVSSKTSTENRRPKTKKKKRRSKKRSNLSPVKTGNANIAKQSTGWMQPS